MDWFKLGQQVSSKMKNVQIEPQPQNGLPVDERTKALIEEAQATYMRGEGVSLEQSTLNLKKRLEAWRKAQAEIALTA